MASQRTPLIGVKFGKLRVTELSRTDRNGVHYKCRCDCGGEIVARSSDLISGKTKSCGCLRNRNYHKFMKQRRELM